MSTSEFKELSRRLERIERMLAKLVGEGTEVATPVEPPPAESPEMSEADRVRKVQAEGRFILETQGFDAYQEYWKQQGRKRKPTRSKRAA